MHDNAVAAVKDTYGSVERQREGEPGETLLLMRQGETYTKWRVFGFRDGIDGGSATEIMGKVDTQMELYFAGTQGENQVDCQNLAKDSDLAPYITWLSR